MIVCVCKRVKSTELREAVAEGATDVEAVSAKLGLGTGCGRCVEFAERMINEERLLLAEEVVVA